MSDLPVLMCSLDFGFSLSQSALTTIPQVQLVGMKTSVATVTGSQQAEFRFACDDSDSRWFMLRPMDVITVRSRVRGEPHPLLDMAAPGNDVVWTGFLDSVDREDDVRSGRVWSLKASTTYKAFEVATDSPDDVIAVNTTPYLSASDVLPRALAGSGIPNAWYDQEPGPEFQLPWTAVAHMQVSDLPGMNPNYITYSALIASVAKLVGRELFSDERGIIHYRMSPYETDNSGTIPASRMMSNVITIETDKNLYNEVAVRFTTFQNESLAGTARIDNTAPTPDSSYPKTFLPPNTAYDYDHYRKRLLTVGAPWIMQQSDAEWYANKLLEWSVRGTAQAFVVLVYSPDIKVGKVYALDYLDTQHKRRYYVTGVMHNVTIGGQAITTLGLTFGRGNTDPWTIHLAPTQFATTEPSNVPGVAAPVDSSQQWKITYYTLHDQNQQPLATAADTFGNLYLQSISGARYFPQGWYRPGGGDLIPYDRIRPCGVALDQSTRQPFTPSDLGVPLSWGDILYLDSDQRYIEVQDTGGGAVPYQCDLFYYIDWTKGQRPPAPPTQQQNVKYIYIKNRGDSPSVLSQVQAGTFDPYQVAAAIPNVGNAGGGPGLQRVVTAALGAVQQLLRGVNKWYNKAVVNSALDKYARSVFDDEYDQNIQCTFFAYYCMVFGTGHTPPSLPNGNKIPNAWVSGDPTNYAWVMQGNRGRQPAPGDVVSWYGQFDNLNENGHVAIIIGVNPPQNPMTPGSFTVAQANCPTTTSVIPLALTGDGTYCAGNPSGEPGLGHVVGIIRYTGGDTGGGSVTGVQ